VNGSVVSGWRDYSSRWIYRGRMWQPQRDPELEELIKTINVGRLVLRARERSGHKQFDFAWRARLQQSLLSRYETGRSLPTIRTLVRIAAQAGTRLTIALGDETLVFDGAFYSQRKQELRDAEFLENRAARNRQRYATELRLEGRVVYGSPTAQ